MIGCFTSRGGREDGLDAVCVASTLCAGRQCRVDRVTPIWSRVVLLAKPFTWRASLGLQVELVSLATTRCTPMRSANERDDATPIVDELPGRGHTDTRV